MSETEEQGSSSSPWSVVRRRKRPLLLVVGGVLFETVLAALFWKKVTLNVSNGPCWWR